MREQSRIPLPLNEGSGVRVKTGDSWSAVYVLKEILEDDLKEKEKMIQKEAMGERSKEEQKPCWVGGQSAGKHWL